MYRETVERRKEVKRTVLKSLPLILLSAGLLGPTWSCSGNGGAGSFEADSASVSETSQPADVLPADNPVADRAAVDRNVGPGPDSSDQAASPPEPSPDLADDSSFPLQEVLVDMEFSGDAAVDQKSWGWQTEWGVVTGSCGELSGELDASESSFLVNEYQFADGENFDPGLLYEGARKRYDEPNAGGSSKCSEVMSLQLLHECEGAQLHKTEMEVSYEQEGKITDFVVLIEGEKVGVSVTRAYLGPTATDYTVEDAKSLLEKKLAGINESTANVSAEDEWGKQILHIWTLQSTWVSPLEEAYDGLDGDLKSDTIVLVTVEVNSTFVVEDGCE